MLFAVKKNIGRWIGCFILVREFGKGWRLDRSQHNHSIIYGYKARVVIGGCESVESEVKWVWVVIICKNGEKGWC